MRHLLLLLPLVAACAQQPVTPPPPLTAPTPRPLATCNPGLAQFTVGQVYGAELAEEARRRSGSRIVRPVRVGEVVTMEFNPERLTLQLDAQLRVQAARCG